jgi:hypothetical protein
VAGGIPYSQSLVISLEASLRSAFNQPDLRLSRKPGKPGTGFSVTLETGDKLAQSNDGRRLPVMGVVTTSEETAAAFYFGFVATFEIQANAYTLQHASISVFHDILAGDLAPLFRAEWDQKAASDITSEHAQPHWHFVQSPARISGFVRALITPSTEFSPEGETDIFSRIADCGKIHFAMTSLLQSGTPPTYKELFQAADFPKWFANLSKYIAAQIGYVIAKAPSAPPAEFVPTQN